MWWTGDRFVFRCKYINKICSSKHAHTGVWGEGQQRVNISIRTALRQHGLKAHGIGGITPGIYKGKCTNCVFLSPTLTCLEVWMFLWTSLTHSVSNLCHFLAFSHGSFAPVSWLSLLIIASNITVCTEFHMFSPCPCGFYLGSKVSSSLLGGLAVLNCTHDDELASHPKCIPSTHPVFPG